MDRKEFLEGLRSYLEPEFSAEEVREHINYYERYITEEVIKGRWEAQVVQELGDPWVIAKTIIDMKENSVEQERSSSEKTFEENRDYGRVRTIQINSWWKKMLMILCIVGALFLVFSLITGLIGILAPILIPVFVVLMVFRLLGRRT